MARLPIEIERRRNLAPRDRIWTAARRLREFTLLELQDATDPLVAFTTCESYLQALILAGYVGTVRAGLRGPAGFFLSSRYRVVIDALVAPRLERKGGAVTQGNKTLAMWRAIKILQSFDWHDIQRAASHPDAPISAQTAKTYVVTLARAGYFQTLREAQPGTAARYRLARDTGPLAPAVTRKKVVFDRNEGRFHAQRQELVALLEEPIDNARVAGVGILPRQRARREL